MLLGAVLGAVLVLLRNAVHKVFFFLVTSEMILKCSLLVQGVSLSMSSRFSFESSLAAVIATASDTHLSLLGSEDSIDFFSAQEEAAKKKKNREDLN